MTTKELIRKAAGGRDVHISGSVGFNRSADRLRALGEKVLPQIENFLAGEFKSDIPPDRMPGNPWPGLSDVLHVYFKVGADSDRVDIGEFLLSLHGWLREEALRAVFIRWGPSSAKAELPAKLVKPVELLAKSGSLVERDFARRILRKLKPAHAAEGGH